MLYLKAFPGYLNTTVQSLSQPQLNTPYRPGGWTVNQLVHHLADSHMNAYSRFKLALTEESPTIKPYFEAKWADLPDSELPMEISLQLIKGIHLRWVTILAHLTPDKFERNYYHPESQEYISLKKACMMYEWHSKHHLAHIQHLIIRESW